jgi:hypothetical protein
VDPHPDRAREVKRPTAGFGGEGQHVRPRLDSLLVRKLSATARQLRRSPANAHMTMALHPGSAGMGIGSVSERSVGRCQGIGAFASNGWGTPKRPSVQAT